MEYFLLCPSPDDFLKAANKYSHFPIYSQFTADFDTILGLYTKIKGDFLLESVENGNNVGLYSIIAKGKKTQFTLEGKTLTIKEYFSSEEKTATYQMSNPLIKIRDYFSKFKLPPMPPNFPPFFGGAIGYLGYETVQYFENIPIYKEGIDVPDGLLVIPEVVLILNNINKQVHIVYTVNTGDQALTNYHLAEKKINAIQEQINKPIAFSTAVNNAANEPLIQSNFEKIEFLKAVEKCKKHIRQGDIIQVVLSQQFKVKTKAKAFDLYRTLRHLNPSPYLFFLDFKEFQIIGSSPEVMVRVIDGEILLKPIAGTRPRGKEALEDKNLASDLLNDPKEVAEHLMLVDLGRNDLGRVAETGSVKVTEYMNIEYYSHVMHIVSSIKAKIKKDKDVFDVIAATFPAGTLSGAPKIRAMEILHEVEREKRGPYGGMVLTLGFNLNLNSCITIRTMLLKNNEAIIQAGCGLVADSDPEQEYKETINKAKALIRTLENTRELL